MPKTASTNAPLNGSASKYSTPQLTLGGGSDAAVSDMEDPIGDAVVRVVLAGDAIFFGSTKDRTALIVRCYSQEGNGEWYVGAPDALQGVLRAIADACR